MNGRFSLFRMPNAKKMQSICQLQLRLQTDEHLPFKKCLKQNKKLMFPMSMHSDMLGEAIKPQFLEIDF